LLTLDQISDRYKTQISVTAPGESYGLTEEAAARRLKEDGPNVLSPPKRRHPFLKYLDCLLTMFNILLIIAGILVYILYAIDPVNNQPNTYLGGILIGVAFLNAFIEFYQLQKSASILESFLNLIPQKCFVIREKRLAQIQASDLVLGDVVFVRMGDKVPADLLIFAATDLKVDNSSLTGESDPQERVRTNTHTNPLEATNLVFNGTLAVNGEGYGIVVRTGDDTVIGQIAGLTAGEQKSPSPLSQEISKFVKIIATIAMVSALVFFIIGMVLYDGNLNFCLTFAISMSVAWVPEGLPATVTMLLTIAAKRMAKRNVLVKDLQGVETLGAITLLATDKTGTLTRNRMTVANIWSSLNFYSALRNVQDPGNPFQVDSPGVTEVLHNATLCSRARFDSTDKPPKDREILADATETGLIRFALQTLNNFDELREIHPKVFEIPFNSETKSHLSIHKKPHAQGPLTLYLKGAPERVLRRCNAILVGKDAVPLTKEHHDLFEEAYEQMAGKGHRVLAFAQLLLPEAQYPENMEFNKDTKNYPEDGYCFLGLVSLEDPPKHGVREAIGRCRSAGIQVMMVTGDHPLTAEAIGRKINLMLSETKEQVAKRIGRPVESIQEHEYQAIVIHGEQIDSMDDDDWLTVFSKNEIIFARTSPKHKLEIVKRAQAIGHIVGVTGDGVNDSPALKKADLGIAMNKSGSDVSKEAAAMILLDDNFASTVHGIEEGRLIFANLKKSIQYTISHSTPEVMATLLYIIVPIPLPLSSILILVVDLGFELFAALTFAWEVPESKTGLMAMPPRKPVTPESVERLMRIQGRKPQAIQHVETGEWVAPSKFANFKHSVAMIFDRGAWRDYFNAEGEELVDANLLSWAYLEIGTINTIGSLLIYFVILYANNITPFDSRQMAKVTDPMYFTPRSPSYTTAAGVTLSAQQQVDALGQAQSAYYLSLMIIQIGNLFACKSRYRLPYGKFMFRNPKTFYGLIAGSILGFCIVYIPPFNVAFGTSYRLNPLYLFISVGFALLVVLYATIRILVLRRFKPQSRAAEITGLQMFPTIRSLGSFKSR
jgi:sodium/potassium-transporting ATPase subunit alpha